MTYSLNAALYSLFKDSHCIFWNPTLGMIRVESQTMLLPDDLEDG